MKLTDDIMQSLEWHLVKELFPKENLPLYIKDGNGRVCRGFFYMNGKTPVFASFGSEVKNVASWAYQNK